MWFSSWQPFETATTVKLPTSFSGVGGIVLFVHAERLAANEIFCQLGKTFQGS
jgi:hypothetical protein